jgi:uncharacterized protein
MDQPRSLPNRIFWIAGENRLRLLWRLLIFSIILGISIMLMTPIVMAVLFFKVQGDAFLFLNAVATAIPITAAVFFTRRLIDHRSIASLGLVTGRKAAGDLLFGVILSALIISGIFLLEWAFGWVKFPESILGNISAPGLIGSMLLACLTYFLVGWGEELLLRGYLFENFKDGMNLLWSVLITSLLFSIGHALNPNFSWNGFVGLFFAGLFFVYARIRSQALWLPIGIHIGWNFFEGAVFGFPVSGMKVFRLIQPTFSGPPLWSGGDFGPEAGLLLLPVLLLGALIIRRRYVIKT